MWLLRIVVKEGGVRRRKRKQASGPMAHGSFGGQPCPLCSTPLAGGERVQSVVYPGTTDRIVEIYGCPNCHPKTGAAKAVRVCPVCKQALRERDYVVGRMFDRGSSRKHLHVLGCTRCRKGA